MSAYEEQMKKIKFLEVKEGVNLGYEEAGEGDKYVLCMHMGFPETYYTRELAKHGYHVYMIWNRGSGPSTTTIADEGKGWYNAWADDVVAFADKMGIDKFIYTGASHGSGTGWHLIWKHPERVSAFIAIVCGPHNISEDTSCFREKVKANPHINFLQGPTDDPALIRRREKGVELSKETHNHQLDLNYGRPLAELGTEEKVQEVLKTLKTPTLLIGGNQDPIARPDLMYRTSICMPNCKLIMYSFMGHSGPSSDYIEEVIPEYLHFLKGVENQGRMYLPIVED